MNNEGTTFNALVKEGYGAWHMRLLASFTCSVTLAQATQHDKHDNDVNVISSIPLVRPIWTDGRDERYDENSGENNICPRKSGERMLQNNIFSSVWKMICMCLELTWNHIRLSSVIWTFFFFFKLIFFNVCVLIWLATIQNLCKLFWLLLILDKSR